MKALILGTGGASLAIEYTLKKLGISCQFISRKRSEQAWSYEDLTKAHISDHPLIVNCTPLGTYPNLNECPTIPYEGITEEHLLFDLIYNPEETLFLRHGKEHGAQIKNGRQMLELQAERSWAIWNAHK
jgi:shikimate dehydrogenase